MAIHGQWPETQYVEVQDLGYTDRALIIDDVSGVVSGDDCSRVDSAVQGRQ